MVLVTRQLPAGVFWGTVRTVSQLASPVAPLAGVEALMPAQLASATTGTGSLAATACKGVSTHVIELIAEPFESARALMGSDEPAARLVLLLGVTVLELKPLEVVTVPAPDAPPPHAVKRVNVDARTMAVQCRSFFGRRFECWLSMCVALLMRC